MYFLSLLGRFYFLSFGSSFFLFFFFLSMKVVVGHVCVCWLWRRSRRSDVLFVGVVLGCLRCQCVCVQGFPLCVFPSCTELHRASFFPIFLFSSSSLFFFFVVVLSLVFLVRSYLNILYVCMEVFCGGVLSCISWTTRRPSCRTAHQIELTEDWQNPCCDQLLAPTPETLEYRPVHIRHLSFTRSWARYVPRNQSAPMSGLFSLQTIVLSSFLFSCLNVCIPSKALLHVDSRQDGCLYLNLMQSSHEKKNQEGTMSGSRCGPWMARLNWCFFFFFFPSVHSGSIQLLESVQILSSSPGTQMCSGNYKHVFENFLKKKKKNCNVFQFFFFLIVFETKW
ncbi:hypothetical protein VP01_2823g1 [Puccinia sorghi]|uniref:Uncharacterized protein n=1 Tax=Puccinia sorghi TaxID=27349 RepID=A0A0L6V2A2_9BASI|nr:hypothetical protein VP01_2823g1 [Puccinia sorghi]